MAMIAPSLPDQRSHPRLTPASIATRARRVSRRASAAPLIYAYEYVVDDEDAKGEYYNWFGESRRLLGLLPLGP